MVCTKKPLLVLIVESRGFFGSANNASCLDNAFVSLHLRIPPRVLHFSAFIFKKYSSSFCTSSLQFGFKPGYSTTLYTGVVKNVVSRYIHRGSSVLGCFLDASKAFYLVDHGMLFDKLLTRGLPVSIVRFLSS